MSVATSRTIQILDSRAKMVKQKRQNNHKSLASDNDDYMDPHYDFTADQVDEEVEMDNDSQRSAHFASVEFDQGSEQSGEEGGDEDDMVDLVDEADSRGETSMDSSLHRTANNDGYWSNKPTKIIKTCRHFAATLIERALSQGWENEQVAELVDLVINELDMNPDQILRLLQKTKSGTPIILCQLIEHGVIFTVDELLGVLKSHSDNNQHFITLVGEALEVGILSVDDPDMLEGMRNVAEEYMKDAELKRFVRTLCEHCPAKATCGRVINTLTINETPFRAASFAYSFASLEAFKDVPGTMKSFLEELKRCREELEQMLDEEFDRNSEGELVDSDEDSEGNLRDFIADDDDDDDEGGLTGEEDANLDDDIDNNHHKGHKRKRAYSEDENIYVASDEDAEKGNEEKEEEDETEELPWSSPEVKRPKHKKHRDIKPLRKRQISLQDGEDEEPGSPLKKSQNLRAVGDGEGGSSSSGKKKKRTSTSCNDNHRFEGEDEADF